jgi:hypothetical protein
MSKAVPLRATLRIELVLVIVDQILRKRFNFVLK